MLGQESNVEVPKVYPNPLRIGSRKERQGVLIGEKTQIFSPKLFLLLHLLPLLIGKVKHFVVACGSKIRGFGVQGDRVGGKH